MSNNSLINKILDDDTIDTFSSINNDIKKLDKTSIATFSKLFNIQGNPEAQRSYLVNILIPSLFSNDKLIKDSILNLIDIIDIIDAQIIPKEFPNLTIINNSIYHIQLKNANEKKSKEFDININSKSNKKIFLQIIPDGLLLIPDFQILENGKQIDKKQLLFNSYLPLNDSGKISLTFLKAPQKLFFLNVLIYKKKNNY